MKPDTIKRHLKKLRVVCIDNTNDMILQRIALAMEMAIQRVTLDGIRGWADLAGIAQSDADHLRRD